MLRGGEVQEIHELRRMGLSVSAISAHTGYDRKTVRKYLAAPAGAPAYGPRSPRPSKLDPYKGYVEERLLAGVWNARVLLREIRAEGYAGSYALLADHLRPLRAAARTMAVRRFETPPGQQAQVDWGALGHREGPDGRLPISGFVFTLGHSRAHFADLATDQTLGTLLAMHEAAFAALGGVPQEILYDRMKTVVLGTDERGEIEWQPIFRDFARYWGFTPRLCRAYRPQTKGKVESGIKYVRRNFLCGWKQGSFEDLRQQLRVWTAEVALPRVHGTTHRVVREAWEEEKPHLQPLQGRPPFPYAPAIVRRVAKDAYVNYRGNRYSVPWPAAGCEVELREVGGELEILQGNVRIALHRVGNGKHQVHTTPAHHWDLPFNAGPSRGGKMRILVLDEAPEVEARSLSAYEALLGDSR